ncbi:hypothetical protein J4E08_13180 [Sagittula sp. NFXS13]|uniref:FliH/SctL family protein n=1 Tax=Sagittula sp. NFXS13 TaxID=2819095 RepID=UPI0032DE5F95
MSYIFERNFDAEQEATQRGEEPVIGAIFTRAELDEAVARAHREGLEAGLAQGQAETLQATQTSASQRQLSALEAVAPALTELIAGADSHRAALETQMVGFVLDVFERLAPDVSAHLAPGQAEREARNAIRMALGSAVLRIWFAPDALDTSGEEVRKAARLAGLGGRLDIKADPELGTGDVRAEWDHGVMTYSFRDICARVLSSLGRTQEDIARSLGQDTQESRT